MGRSSWGTKDILANFARSRNIGNIRSYVRYSIRYSLACVTVLLVYTTNDLIIRLSRELAEKEKKWNEDVFLLISMLLSNSKHAKFIVISAKIAS